MAVRFNKFSKLKNKTSGKPKLFRPTWIIKKEKNSARGVDTRPGKVI